MEKFTSLDLYLSAYLSLNGCPPELEIRNGKVLFSFRQSGDVNRLIGQFNSNSPVPVADFTTAVKTLRGRMIEKKGTRQ
jgi:hypothetical protein